ncbi:hypothetical protein AV656_09360 [Bhargavaea cecembensis]|uniref:Uncharacterized protein n=1 Tax=Bhargavaea cecembensis TaxID=394098 RepID=A0A163F1J9_9BACL|nr:hypothetical protein [Bhargavaea cecembensis]KZE37731.1 hypothetical protein AV656_09360 [Bhargavaea cecembensis]
MNFNYYRSELKFKGAKKHKILGVVSDLLLSKELFPRNDDLRIFIKEIFDIEFKDYIFSSRTLIVARVTRSLYLKTDKELEIVRKKLIIFFEKYNKLDVENRGTTNLSKWIKGISND